jgi:DNA-binding CsgD family transcriptional regulator
MRLRKKIRRMGRQVRLTQRERQVLQGLSMPGKTSAQVAAGLGIRPETLRTHLKNAMRKLNVRTGRHAVIEAMRRGLIH